MVRCEHCGKEFEDHDIIMHTQVCEMAPHECIYCHQMIPADVKEQHKLECVKRPVSCEHCGESMAFDMLAGHGTSCRLSVPITCKFVLFRAILVNSLTGSRELCQARSRLYRHRFFDARKSNLAIVEKCCIIPEALLIFGGPGTHSEITQMVLIPRLAKKGCADVGFRDGAAAAPAALLGRPPRAPLRSSEGAALGPSRRAAVCTHIHSECIHIKE